MSDVTAAEQKQPAPLIVERRDAVLRVTINRPEKRNALSRPLLNELRTAFLDGAQDETVRLAVLTGAGDRSFAAGGDLKDLSSVRTEEEARAMSEETRNVLDAIRTFPVPVVAALNGDALGGGAELAVACDFRIAVSSARIGFVQGRLAISTAWGGGIDLMQLLGPVQGLRLLCTAEILSAQEAQGIGLLDAVTAEHEDLDDLMERFTAPMLRQTPQVMRAFKALSAAVRRGEPRAALETIENHRFAKAWVHDDHWAAAEAILNGSRHR